MGFRESLSCGFGEQQLYYESPVNSYLTHRHFGEGIAEPYDYLAPDRSEIRLLPEMRGGRPAHCALLRGKGRR
jgi:hypothetical protein